MCRYSYDGPVLGIGNRVVTQRWHGETYAESESKARSNLAYQYKKRYNLVSSAKVTLPGEIKKGAQ